MPEQETPGLEGLLNGAVRVAKDAGSAIMEVYLRADHGESVKEDGSPLTLADRAAHEVIENGLKAITPGIPLLSEESEGAAYEVRRLWKRYWLVDPLDGTKEFIKRNGEFTVNIAMIEEGYPVIGVVCAPALNVTYYAARGVGSFKEKDGTLARMRTSEAVEGSLKVVASRSHGSEKQLRFLERLKGAECVALGSSLKFCIVAEGGAHLYPRFGPTMEWDTAAAQCVVEEAGGAVTDLNGERLKYNKPDLHNPEFMVSCAGFPWRHLIEGLPE